MIDELQRAEAARAILDTQPPAFRREDQKEAEVAAFVAIFHPDHVLPPGERYTEEGP